MTSTPDTLPEIRDGRLPMGEGRKSRGRGQPFDIDAVTRRLIECMVVGADSEIEVTGTDRDLHGNYVPEKIPARTPMRLEHAARASGMSVKRARRLQTNPVFLGAHKAAIEAYRACQEPKNIAVAAQIRDDQLARSRDRLGAIEVIRGPRPVPGVTVNVQQNNGAVAPAGYVIDLSPQDRDPIEAKPIDATPREGNAGNAARDVEAERA